MLLPGADRGTDDFRAGEPRLTAVRKAFLQRIAELSHAAPTPSRLFFGKDGGNELRLPHRVFTAVSQGTRDHHSVPARREQTAEHRLLLLALLAQLRQVGTFPALAGTGVELDLILVAQQQRLAQHTGPAVVVYVGHQPETVRGEDRRHPRVESQRMALRELYRQRGRLPPVADEGHGLRASQSRPRGWADVLGVVAEDFDLLFQLKERVRNIPHHLVKRGFPAGGARRPFHDAGLFQKIAPEREDLNRSSAPFKGAAQLPKVGKPPPRARREGSAPRLIPFGERIGLIELRALLPAVKEQRIGKQDRSIVIVPVRAPRAPDHRRQLAGRRFAHRAAHPDVIRYLVARKRVFHHRQPIGERQKPHVAVIVQSSEGGQAALSVYPQRDVARQHLKLQVRVARLQPDDGNVPFGAFLILRFQLFDAVVKIVKPRLRLKHQHLRRVGQRARELQLRAGKGEKTGEDDLL